MRVVVYTRPGCPQCDWTKRILDEAGVEYTALDVTEDPDAEVAAKAFGYTQLPVVVVMNGSRTGHWSGFRPEKLRGLKDTGGY